jgi:hypothetical protein
VFVAVFCSLLSEVFFEQHSVAARLSFTIGLLATLCFSFIVLLSSFVILSNNSREGRKSKKQGSRQNHFFHNHCNLVEF